MLRETLGIEILSYVEQVGIIIKVNNINMSEVSASLFNNGSLFVL